MLVNDTNTKLTFPQHQNACSSSEFTPLSNRHPLHLRTFDSREALERAANGCLKPTPTPIAKRQCS
ncbi:hypothetical protein MUCCIDRAFT_154663 [Mucor lusitanicus CBS 277.49]|uniref:Uncharacterized protein n=1 Tax=Mucor lusitanicus CBS 277.49 TaxID=747725 RepID=A0A162R1D3_MUCCL|nr:hypothetical protein MUCCIDRAFT_154663 [Mucor lusitanicus CBS 277.49]